MKKRGFVWVIFLFIIQFVAAQQIAEKDALWRAQKFLTSSHRSGGKGAPAVAPTMELAYVGKQDDEVHFYVFNSASIGEKGGFVIVGGDETARDILGYSTHGKFNYDSIPDNVRYWLLMYDEQISQGIASSARPVSRVVSRATVPGLLSTTWNQDDPYNSELPSLGNGYTGRYALATGCVATAMAQVMKFHEYPQHGVGSKSYTGINNLTFEADFANTTYDWANMLDDYSSGYTATEAEAVGTLMYHCGVSVDMSYGQIYNGGSGAQTRKVPQALINTFGYDKEAGVRYRDYYSDEEWEDLIYDELAAGRPVLYSASSDEGGHAFVCHGYDSDYDYFTINWGWGGDCDGYYPLSGTKALTTEGTGIGGSSEGSSYTRNQMVVVGVRPDEGNDYPLNINCYGEYSLSTSNSTDNAVTSYTLNRASASEATLYMICSPINYTPIASDFQMGVRITESTTGKTYFNSSHSFSSLPYGSYYSAVPATFSTSILPYNGTYEVEPVFRPSDSSSDDDWQLMRYDVTITVPTIVITGGVDDQPIDVEFTLSDNVIQVARTATISHNRTYNGTITYTSSNPSVATVDANGTITGVSVGTTTITASASATVAYNATVEQFTVTVVATQKDPIGFSISATSLMVGDLANITSPTGYEGTVTYTSSNPSVATVSNAGVVTAVAAGTTTITVTGSSTDTYSSTVQTFLVTVTESLPEGFVILSAAFPYGDFALPTDNNGTLLVIFKNNTSSAVTQPVYFKVVLNGGATLTSSYTFQDVAAGSSVGLNLNLSYPTYMTEGNPYTIYFYYDSSYTQPYNIPSFTYTWCTEGTISYEMTSAGYGTICLPFAAEVPTGLLAYECSSMDEEGRVQLTRALSLAKDTPYILKGTAGTYDFTGPLNPNDQATYTKGMLTGVTSNSYALQAGDCVLQSNGGVVGFYNATPLAGETFTQYHAFLSAPSVFKVTEKKGDFDGDFDVDTTDVGAVVGTVLAGGTYPSNYDINEDGVGNVADVTAVVNLLLNSGAQGGGSATTYGTRVAAYSQEAASSGKEL